MTEHYITKTPTQDELSAEYRGLNFDEFKMLSDKDIKLLYLKHKSDNKQNLSDDPELLRAYGSKIKDDEFLISLQEVATLKNFTNWRIYGVPDRDVSYEEIMGNLQLLVSRKQEEDSSFGALLPEHFDKLTDNERLVIDGLFQYFYTTKQAFEYMTIDEESLRGAVGLNEDDIHVLLNSEVILPLGRKPETRLTNYVLNEPYYSNFLVSIFSESFV